MALLQSVKVIEPIAQTYDTGNAKAVAGAKVEFINFGFAGLPQPAQPAAPAPAIDITATPAK